MVASAIVDLPQPDSPTSPNASPGGSPKLTSSSDAADAPATALMLDRDAIEGENVSHRAQASCRPVARKLKPMTSEEIGRRRNQGHVRPDEDHAIGLLHHPAPVRIRRRQADAEKAEHADGDGRVAKTQEEIDDQGTARIGQDLNEQDEQRALAAHAGGRNVVAVLDVERHGAHDARDDRRLRQRDDGDDVQCRCAETRDDDQVENDLGECQERVADAHDQAHRRAAAIAGEQPEHRAERRPRRERRPARRSGPCARPISGARAYRGRDDRRRASAPQTG